MGSLTAIRSPTPTRSITTVSRSRAIRFACEPGGAAAAATEPATEPTGGRSYQEQDAWERPTGRSLRVVRRSAALGLLVVVYTACLTGCVPRAHVPASRCRRRCHKIGSWSPGHGGQSRSERPSTSHSLNPRTTGRFRGSSHGGSRGPLTRRCSRPNAPARCTELPRWRTKSQSSGLRSPGGCRSLLRLGVAGDP